MPIIAGKYKNPGWVNGQTPAINAAELNAISQTLEALDEGGGTPSLPSLSNPASASDLLSGKQLIDANGNVLTGTMPTRTQATPSISVSSGGLITASATQSAGYVAAGTKSATQQLTTQGAQTITPGTSAKTIAAGRYLTGTQTVQGDANLVAGNIKSGVSIFGVNGSYAGSTDIPTYTLTIINNTSQILVVESVVFSPTYGVQNSGDTVTGNSRSTIQTAPGQVFIQPLNRDAWFNNSPTVSCTGSCKYMTISYYVFIGVEGNGTVTIS